MRDTGTTPEATEQPAQASGLAVLIVTSVHPPFDKRIWRHATALADRGHRVTVVAPWPSAHDHERNRGAPAIEPFTPAKGLLDRLVGLPIRIARICRDALRNQQYDIVHFHDIDLWPVALAIGRQRVPMIYDVHENFHHETHARIEHIRGRVGRTSIFGWALAGLQPALSCLTWLYDRGFARYVGNVVLVTPAQRATHNQPGVRVTEARNYASTRSLGEPLPYSVARGPRVVFTGSHYEENGSLLLLEIAARVARRVEGVRFVVTDMFTSEAFGAEFEACRAALGLDTIVEIVAPVPPDRIFDLLNAASIGLIASLPTPRMQAGIPTRVFEYMAAGLPVVAPALPLISEVLNADSSGILVEPANADEFANAIAQILTDQGRRQELSAVARMSFLTRFTWESQVDRLEELYSHLVSSRIDSTGSRRP